MTLSLSEGITDMIMSQAVDEIRNDTDMPELIRKIRETVDHARSAWDKMNIKDYNKTLKSVTVVHSIFAKPVSMICLLSFLIGSLEDLYHVLKNEKKRTVISNLIYLFSHLYEVFLKYEDEDQEEIEFADNRIDQFKIEMERI
jgi:flagellin-specific chaperone FliS